MQRQEDTLALASIKKAFSTMPEEQIELFAKSLFPAISGKTVEMKLDQCIKSFCFAELLLSTTIF